MAKRMERLVMDQPHRNLRTMVKNECGTAIESQFDCAFDALSRRSSVVNSGQAFTADAFNLYGYNDRNELGQSSRYLGNNIAVTATPVPSEHRAYQYDPIGNRTQITAGSDTGAYTSNALNQYTQESVPGGADTYSYDDDGNLTAIDYGSAPDVAYTYDAENRLIAVAPPTPVANDKKTEFLYDYMGRRLRKKISTYTDGAWVQETQKLYVYDGWNMITEIDDSGTRYHVWGLDLSGTLQGAGGVGGLLGTFTGTDAYFALYDTNGNVTDYLNAQGAVVAHYEYDPYGGSISASGEKQSDFALRFSTKYLDDTGLYYYGYRYYSPGLGRWLSRDPSEEEGGSNLYNYVMNEPITRNDYLGLWMPFIHHYMTDWAWNAVKMDQDEEAYRHDMGDILVERNISIDREHYYHNHWHFCRSPNESIRWAIEAYSNILDGKQEEMWAKLELPSEQNCNEALEIMGQLSHPYQDYYAHAIDKRSNGSWGTIGYIKGNPESPHPDMKPVSYPDEHNRSYFPDWEPGGRAPDAPQRNWLARIYTRYKFSEFSPRWWKGCRCYAKALFNH